MTDYLIILINVIIVLTSWRSTYLLIFLTIETHYLRLLEKEMRNDNMHYHIITE